MGEYYSPIYIVLQYLLACHR